MGKQIGPILEGAVFAAGTVISGGTLAAVLGSFALGAGLAEAQLILAPKVRGPGPASQRITLYDSVAPGTLIYGNSCARHRALIHDIISADH